MNKNSALIVAVIALIVGIIALVIALTASVKKIDSEVVESTLMDKPQIISNALEKFNQMKVEEARKQAQKLLEENIELLNNNPDDGIIANPEGKITLVEFFDFSCGYCHRIYPAIKSVAAKNPDVKVVAKALTFVSPVSRYAAKAALAAKEQGKFAEMYTALFEFKGPLTEAKIDELAVLNGLDLEKLKSDMNSAKVEEILNNTAKLAGDIRVNGVPTLVLNGQLLQTLDESVIQSAIDAAK